MEEAIKQHGSLEKYLTWLIDETQEYIVAIKPNMAFYEHSPETREVMMRLMKYAGEKYGIIKILDVKRGDILDTQTEWAKADIKNFDPDIVTLNPYMGGADVVLPYLNQNSKVCTYILTATSNPGAREFQDIYANGLTNYQNMVLLAHSWDKSRVGFVVGSTKKDAIYNIRMIEKEHGFTHAHCLCPGFGKQGGDMDFVKYAGKTAVYPLSSSLTKDKYLNGKSPKEMAKIWRDDINTKLAEAEEVPSITGHVVNNLIKEDLVLIPQTTDFAKWPLLKKGQNKLEAAGIKLAGSAEEKEKVLRDAITKKVLAQDDFGAIYLQMRDVMGQVETRRLMAYLYAKMIKESGVAYDRIGSIAYGAINTGDLASYILNKPAFLLRKERGTEATHSDVVGALKKDEVAIMIEDVTTSADSLIKDVKMLREVFGVKINDAFVFVKRTPEGEQACKENGIKLHYVMDMAGLKEYIRKSPNVSEDVKKMILK
jgi:orotidine 5'-phosphate decarboxylase subfamily 2